MRPCTPQPRVPILECGAVPEMAVRPALGLPEAHRQRQRGLLDGLDLWLLIHAQHQGAIRRREVEADNVGSSSNCVRWGPAAHLPDEQRIGGEPEDFHPARLQPEGLQMVRCGWPRSGSGPSAGPVSGCSGAWASTGSGSHAGWP